jgi:hypothetical protein
VWVSPFPDDGGGSDVSVGDEMGVESGEAVPLDGVELVEEMTSDNELVDAPVVPGVQEAGVLSLSAEAIGDVLVDSAAAGLVRRLAEDEL